MWLFTTKWLPLVLPVMWTAAMVMAVPFTYPGEYMAVSWRDLCVTSSDELLLNMKIIGSTVIILPLAVVLVLYVHIYVVVRRASKRVQAVGRAGGATTGKSVSNHHKRMAMVLFVLYIVAAIVYVFYVLFFFFNSELTKEVREWFFLFTNIGLMMINCCNPILYAVLFKPIQKEYKRIFCRSKEESEGTLVTVMSQSVA